jgi:murein DD-endopeptidase MepM/ murein hydrolase activator NlpD
MHMGLVIAVVTAGAGAGAGAAVARPIAASPTAADSLAAFSVAEAVRALLQDDWLTWPLAGKVTGRFGEPRSGHRHEGIDIPVPVGTPIEAAGPGKVVMREWQDGYGNYTCIRHATVLTCYAHQSRFHVKRGERVDQGEVIGYSGDSGTSEAPHLHFEVRDGRRPWAKPVNPRRYLPRSAIVAGAARR